MTSPPYILTQSEILFVNLISIINLASKFLVIDEIITGNSF